MGFPASGAGGTGNGPERSEPPVGGIVVGALLVLAVVIGGIVWLGHDAGTGPGPTGHGPPPSSSATPPPYVALKPGTCFDTPGLNSHVARETVRPCTAPHDAEVISDETLTGSFATEKQLQVKVLALCDPDTRQRMRSIPENGRSYYAYAIYPSLSTYQVQGEDTVSCALTLSNSTDGKQLTDRLP
ncbi:hypothetical protein NGB36_12955 [Streptomyces sp. RB6PN25]|uniref:Septum formation-related domain-containing protein n=1 Tax=Streptomyces humicola TaxID=2953240 RepID=A0ABT1PUY2_9ACTN|nr:hypothetical protein [Streptomyces humicola]MCQ4081484.1 hypothetical protein [Streptomyces humicola]